MFTPRYQVVQFTIDGQSHNYDLSALITGDPKINGIRVVNPNDDPIYLNMGADGTTQSDASHLMLLGQAIEIFGMQTGVNWIAIYGNFQGTPVRVTPGELT